MMNRTEFEASNLAKGLNADGSIKDELPLTEKMFPNGTVTVNRSSYNIPDVEDNVTAATDGFVIDEQGNVVDQQGNVVPDANVVNPMARAAIAAKKAKLAAIEMLKHANTSHDQ